MFLGNDYTISLSASDPDGDPLSWRLVNAPEGTRLTGAGALDWSPDLGDLGESYDFVVGVLDGRGGTDRLSWQVTVPNRAPEITTDPVGGRVVGEAYRYDVVATDEDRVSPDLPDHKPAAARDEHQRPERFDHLIPSEEQGQETFLEIVRAEDTLGSRTSRATVSASTCRLRTARRRSATPRGPCERWRPVHVRLRGARPRR